MPRRSFAVLAATAAAVSAALATVPLAAGPAPAAPLGAAAVVAPLAGSQVGAADLARLRSEAAWIRRAQSSDGALHTAPDQAHVRPYLANFAALGLAASARATGDLRDLDASWRWLSWYRRHMDRRGFVTDYDRVGGRLRSTGDMDSTDAYAGTYLIALRATHLAAPHRSRLRAERAGIAAAVRAIAATQDRDGLTWAKPAWRVKYLMDQAETYAGLRAAVDLAGWTGDRVLARRAAASAARLKAGVDRLWNPRTSGYDWAVHANGAREPVNWRRLYPDAMQEAWAVAFGLVPPTRSRALLAALDRRQPAWDRPTARALVERSVRPAGYWVPAAWAHERASNFSRARLAVDRIATAADRARRAWPYTPSDAGQIAVATSGRRALLVP